AIEQDFDEDFFGPLRILGGDGADFDVCVGPKCFLRRLDGFHFVVFDADAGAGGSHGFHRNAGAVQNFRGFLEHHAMISGEVRLALTAIDYYGVDALTFGDLHFDVRGKGSTAESYDPGFLNGLDDLVRGHVVDILRRAVEDILAGGGIGLEVDGGGEVSAGGGGERDAFDASSDRGVHGDGNESAGFGDGFASYDFLALADDRDSGCAGVLGERHDEGRRERKTADGQRARGLFELGHVQASREAFSVDES